MRGVQRPDLDTDVVIVGAGAAGLAVAAVLVRRGLRVELLDKSDAVGASWRNRYERLHLHTDRGHSGLPFRPMPKSFPRYPSKDQVARYLEDYAEHFELRPRMGIEVTSIARRNGSWETVAADRSWSSRCVVVATSFNGEPHVPHWDGEESFPGPITHSSEFVSGASLRDKDVLVVGFGNSGGEIAIDLHEHGARPAIVVRSPVNVLPKELLGIPILAWGLALAKLPAGAADLLSAPLLRWSIGDITRHGLRKLPYGPQEQILKDGRVPLLDVGTMKLIKRGELEIRPGISRFEGDTVVFEDGSRKAFDALILATGFLPRLDRILASTDGLGPGGTPRRSGDELEPGLYTCGFHVSPTGMLREIGIEARRIGEHMAARHFST